MDVGQIILGRPWIFNNDGHIYGHSNMCLFEHEGKKVKLLPSKPKYNITEKKSVAAKQAKISLISAKDIDHEMTKKKLIIILIAREVPKESITSIPCEVAFVINEFTNVFPKDLPG